METKQVDYSKHKVLSTYVKPRSPFKVMFLTDDPDEWFVDVVYFKKKSSIVHSTSVIIRKDMESWEQGLISKGWNMV